MKGVATLQVTLRFSKAEQVPVGRLALVNRRILFEFAPSFLEHPLPLSPFHLRPAPGLFSEPKGLFDGLFGVFNDSLPDGWGRLLLDRSASRLGLDPLGLTPIDRLACVGDRGIGALSYEPELPLPRRRGTIDLDALAAETRSVLAGHSTEVLPELLRIGGSPAGARPKALLAWRESDGRLVHGEDEPPDGYLGLLVKFPAKDDPRDAGVIEYAYSQMAAAAGVAVPRTLLLPAGGRRPGYFATERFDRQRGFRLHAHTLSGLLHADHRAPTLDYEALLRATLHLTRDERQVHAAYRLAVFNVLSHNRDDHAKQFSFLMDRSGEWRASPAYDLVYSQGPGGEHSTTVAGEGREVRRGDLMRLAERAGIGEPVAAQIIEEVAGAVERWRTYADEAGVGRTSTTRIAAAIRTCLGGLAAR